MKVEVWNTKTGESTLINGVDARERCAFDDWSMEKPEKKKPPVKRKAPAKKVK